MTSDDEKGMLDSEEENAKSNQRLVELKSLRTSTKGNITRIRNLIANKGSTLPPEELECRLGILESYFKQILTVQAGIDKICPEVEKATNATLIGEIEESYISAKSNILKWMPKQRTSVSDVSMMEAPAFPPSTSRLRREIKLPKYEGKYSEFPKFITLFNKLVHQDKTLDNCERFLILKESLGSRPLAAIADFDETEDNYPKALERLKKCFDKKALMFEEHIAALFEMRKVTRGSAEHLRQVINTTNARLSAMLSLGNYENIANALIIFLVIEKLDPESQAKWEEAVDYTKLSTWDECSTILSRRCQTLEARETKSERNEETQKLARDVRRDVKAKFIPKRNQTTSLAIEHAACTICRKTGHEVINCSKFLRMSPHDRYSATRSSRLCILCLKKGHWFMNCNAEKCNKCNQPHHVLLHRNITTTQVSNAAKTEERHGENLSSAQNALCTSLRSPVVKEVFLETAIVLIKDGFGRYHPARAILDSASQINLMCNYLAQTLKLATTSCALDANGISDISTNITKKVQTTMKSRTSNYEMLLEFYVLPKITGRKPDQFVDITRWGIPKDIKMADPNFSQKTSFTTGERKLVHNAFWADERFSPSQINLMCNYLAQTLKLATTSCALDANGISDISTNITKKVQTTMKSRTSNYEMLLEFYVLPKITGRKPDQFVDITRWGIPKDIKMADPNFNIPSRIDLLLGAEIFLDLLSTGQIKLNCGLPRLQKTLLGWVVSGGAKKCEGDRIRALNMTTVVTPKEVQDRELNTLVEQFWETEKIPMKTNFLTDEEQECERIFLRSVRRDGVGRFIVKIPFKDSVKQLGDSFQTAERRFLALERRLGKNTALQKAYAGFMDEYIKLGHMVEVETAEVGGLKYFSPHQYVLRPESTSTKLRVVFDCSCKTSSGLSLNDVMLKGPIVQDDLLAIVLRFRSYKFALTADVTKMYRQAWVADEDTKYQAIVWRESSQQRLKTYRLLTVTYGTTAAPYLATRCLKKLAEDNKEEYPLGSEKILTDFYMDDFISGANTEEELIRTYTEVSELTDSAHFTLRKWHSNNAKFLQQLPDGDKERPLRVNDCEIIKTLGIVWEPTLDAFTYVWPDLPNDRSITKRIVLAEMSSLFDPLGLVNPVVVKAKMFIQDLWIMKLPWDAPLPLHLHTQWAEFRKKLIAIKEVKIPRYILSPTKSIRVEMHGFADASERAYGCCLYVRCIDNKNNVTVRLWSAKSRVAPLKTKSLPRLELMAAHLLSTLVLKMQSSVPIQINAVYLWSDSEIVLEWLSAHPSHWTTFVANRVAIIQEATKSAVWRYVSSRQNPADIVSRGMYVEELLNSFWFSGPLFLAKPCDEWPVNKERHRQVKVEDERRKRITALTADIKQNYFVEWLEGRSEFERTRKRVAYFLCLARRVKGSRGELPTLTAAMLDEATIRIIYCLQQFFFSVEYQALKKENELNSSSRIKGLNVFIDTCYDVEILRVGGRLRNSNLSPDTKHPILLPAESKFVRSYVRYVHETNMHVGTQALMAILRQRFWIVHARKVVRSVTTKCLRCFRCQPRIERQVMGNLPAERVNIAKPFNSTGVDFCGPIMTTFKQKGMRLIKSYVAVFICFATKAVHMEVVSDLSAKAFIAALKRFVARRGLCAQLFCDNATNFVGARRELKELREAFCDQQLQNILSKYCAAHNIDFRHIPPRSPHFGGLWEAAVKSAKYHLTRILGESFLTFEELSTVVAEMEAILNSRPLTTMSNDSSDVEVLTPSHFLIGEPLAGISEPILEDKPISHLNRWRRLTAIQQHFWKRWSSEYLHELQKRAKWTRKRRNLKEGDLVLVVESNLPPKQWLLGRTTKTFPDKDGYVRVIEVKTKNGSIRRAIQKVAPIPIEE